MRLPSDETWSGRGRMALGIKIMGRLVHVDTDGRGCAADLSDQNAEARLCPRTRKREFLEHPCSQGVALAS